MAFAARAYGEQDGFGAGKADKLRSAVIAAGLQGAGIAALLLLPTAIISEEPKDGTIKMQPIAPDIDPPKPVDQVDKKVSAAPPAPGLTAPDPVFKSNRDFGAVNTPILDGDFGMTPLAGSGTISGIGDDFGAVPVPVPVPDPVLIKPQWNPRFAGQVQPDFPSGKLRAGIEGKVTVRVLVGTDGRAKAVEQVSATDADFFRATERQALRKWRFKPATRDGVPVEEWMTVSVNFTIKDR